MSTIRDFLVTQEIAIQAGGPGSGRHAGDKPYVSEQKMTDAGFRKTKSEEDKDGNTLDWYKHQSYPDRHFLVREDRGGVMIGDKNGISDTVSGPDEIHSILKNVRAAGGGASGGSGGGPAPDRMVPAKGASLVGSQFNPPLTDEASYNVPDKGNMHSKGGKIKELDVKKVSAGGPGSGRHKEWDKQHNNAFPNAQSLLKARGYKNQGEYADDEHSERWEHPTSRKAGAVNIWRQGASGVKWIHESHSGGSGGDGQSWENLRDYLNESGIEGK